MGEVMRFSSVCGSGCDRALMGIVMAVEVGV